jgi:hypothetical protein
MREPDLAGRASLTSQSMTGALEKGHRSLNTFGCRGPLTFRELKRPELQVRWERLLWAAESAEAAVSRNRGTRRLAEIG